MEEIIDDFARVFIKALNEIDEGKRNVKNLLVAEWNALCERYL